MSFNAINEDDDYFNDLSRQPRMESQDSTSPLEHNGTDATGEETGAAKPKRIACVVCRKRKLRCDGNKPKCATCARLGHNCAYDEVRRKSGPKRGYVKDLEARLAQVEGKLKVKDNKTSKNTNDFVQYEVEEPILATEDPMGTQARMQRLLPGPVTNMASEMLPDSEFVPQINLDLDQNFSWEMIALGLEEPMPTQEAVDELTQIFLDKLHPSLPVIHKYRYYTSMNLAPDRRPPICLRYIMWCHAASITEKYMHHQDIFYRRARKYIELDEMKGQGEAFVSLAHAQTWILISAYEFKMMYFPRAWMSVGRAARMVLMMGLNRVDGVGLDVKQCLPPPKDWTEREERRRTFWMAYCIDRYASIGTGWPMTIDEKDIMNCLPVSEEAYESSTAQKAPTLEEAMRPQQAAQLSPMAGVVLVSHFFGLNLTHLHRPEPNQQEHDMNGPFWKRHRTMDNDLLKTALQLPSHLRLPSGIRNPNVVFLNFALHTSTICLHQAAIFKAERNEIPNAIIEQSRTRCILAAAEIAGVMRLTSHLDVAGMNPFMAFCLYVAGRVFVQHLKKMPDDQEVRQSLEFLLAAMRAIQRKNPLTESFLVQLNVDIEGSGLDFFLHNPDYTSQYVEGLDQSHLPAEYDPSKVRCTPIFHISETSEDSRSPGEQRSPEDTRFPKYDIRKESPTLRTEDPRQQTYAYRNADVISRIHAVPRPFFPANMQPQPYLPPGDIQNNSDIQPQPFDKIFPSDDWNQGNIATVTGLNAFADNDNINGMKVNSRHMDIEMADQSAHSRGPTPQSNSTYNHSSSNTSYSPSQTHDDDKIASGTSGGANYMTGFAPPSHNTIFTGEGVKSAMKVSAQEQEDPFKIPAGWDRGMGMTPGSGATPGSLTGMTPEGGWEKLMDSIGWETGRTG